MTKGCDSTCWLRPGRAKAKRHLATVVDRFSPHSTGRTTTANIAGIFACKCSRHHALSRCSLQAWWLDSAWCTFARHVLPYPSSSLRLPVCRNFTHAACHQHAVMPPSTSIQYHHQSMSSISRQHSSIARQVSTKPFSSSLLIKPSLRHAIHPAHNGTVLANHRARPATTAWVMVRRV